MGAARRFGNAEKTEEKEDKFTKTSVASCLAHMREHTEDEHKTEDSK